MYKKHNCKSTTHRQQIRAKMNSLHKLKKLFALDGNANVDITNNEPVTNVLADLQNEEAQILSHNSKFLFVGIRPIRCLQNSQM